MIRLLLKSLVAHLSTPSPRSAQARRRRGQRGMTLVEIMVVVVIMSLVAGVVGVAVFNTLSDAQTKTAGTQIKQISDALDLHRLNHRHYPSTAEGLTALSQGKGNSKPVMEMIPKDPWGNDYVYIHPGSHNQGSFDLMSYGSDGVSGGGDDIGNWQTAE